MSRAAIQDTDDLKALYQDLILEHSKQPRNARLVEAATCTAHGNNPLCGDKVTITANVADDGKLQDVAAMGKGCAISMASASMMTEAVRGLTVAEAQQVFRAVQHLCTGKADVTEAQSMVPTHIADHIEKLAALSGVRNFPVRVKCATLPWHTLISCLAGQTNASTETA
jgi:nitrogen fixation protein NifU and related proteins